jgi:nitrite reductase (NADH) small subunit
LILGIIPISNSASRQPPAILGANGYRAGPGTCLTGATRIPFPAEKQGAPVTDGNEIPIGSVDAFPVGKMHIVQAGALEIGVVRQQNGTIHAIRNRCPHKGAPICLGSVGGTMLPSAPGTLTFGLDQTVVRCPWHGYEFDLATGQGLFSNAGMRVRTFPVAVRDGVAYLTRLPSPAQRPMEGEQVCARQY